jgi:hypothetical protein
MVTADHHSLIDRMKRERCARRSPDGDTEAAPFGAVERRCSAVVSTTIVGRRRRFDTHRGVVSKQVTARRAERKRVRVPADVIYRRFS